MTSAPLSPIAREAGNLLPAHGAAHFAERDAVIASLERVTEAVREGRSPAAPDVDLVAMALSLQPTEPLTARDRLVVNGMAQFFPNLSARARAESFATQWERYAASAWRRDRAAAELPPRLAGKLGEVFWRALKLHDWVLSAERLRRLGGSRT